MSEDRDRDDDPLRDLWLANWEQHCIDHVESEPDYEGQLQSERDLTNQKLWVSFQNTATSIAQLYKERLQSGISLWVPFQTAAGTATSLYKEASDGFRRNSEVGTQCGYQRRNKELLNWARKKRRHIRREDLISYLAGKQLPPRPHHRGSPKPRLMLAERHGSPIAHQMEALHCHHMNLASPAPVANIEESNLNAFHEALAYSNGSVGRRQRSTDLSAFIASEFARHCKRSAPASPPHDVNMDSPTHHAHKRARFM